MPAAAAAACPARVLGPVGTPQVPGLRRWTEKIKDLPGRFVLIRGSQLLQLRS